MNLKLQYFGNLMGRTDSFEKNLYAGKDLRQEEKGTTEDETVGWHYQLDGHEFKQAPGVGNGQGSLACCSHEVTKSQTQLSDWTELKFKSYVIHFMLFLPTNFWNLVNIFFLHNILIYASCISNAAYPQADSR